MRKIEGEKQKMRENVAWRETSEHECTVSLASICLPSVDKSYYPADFAIRSAPRELWVDLPTIRENTALIKGWIEMLCAPADNYVSESQRYIEQKFEELVRESVEFLASDFMRTYIWLKYQIRSEVDRHHGENGNDLNRFKQLFISTFDGTWEGYLRGVTNCFDDKNPSAFFMHNIREATNRLIYAKKEENEEVLKDPGKLFFSLMQFTLGVADGISESVAAYRHPAMQDFITTASFDWRDFAKECGINWVNSPDLESMR